MLVKWLFPDTFSLQVTKSYQCWLDNNQYVFTVIGKLNVMVTGLEEKSNMNAHSK